MLQSSQKNITGEISCSNDVLDKQSLELIIFLIILFLNLTETNLGESEHHCLIWVIAILCPSQISNYAFLPLIIKFQFLQQIFTNPEGICPTVQLWIAQSISKGKLTVQHSTYALSYTKWRNNFKNEGMFYVQGVYDN